MPVSIINIIPRCSRANSEDEYSGEFQCDMKPFLFCLKASGLHHFYFSENRRRKLWRRLALAYRGFVPGILAVNFIFSLGEFMNVKGFDSGLLNNIITSIWFLQVTFFALNNALRCWRWERFYKNWNSYREEYKIDLRAKNKIMATITVISYVIWLVVATAFMAFSMSTPRPPSGFMLKLPGELTGLVTAFIVVAYFFFVSTWFLLTAQFTVICLSLCRLLRNLYQGIKCCFEDKNKISEQIEGFRRQHDNICVMISEADDILAIFIMVTVASTIPLIVLTLYFVIFVTDEVQTFSYAATWWSISLSTLQLTVVFLFGGAVNYMAHKSTDLLYRLDLNSFSQSSIAQLSVFLNRLTSQPIGLTACGLFVLDKPTIITFVGSIATYAIVMIQFKPGDNSCQAVCNCTGTI